MIWEINGKSYHFDRDFKELTVNKRVRVVKMVRNLLKIQREDAALLSEASVPLIKKAIQR